MDGWIGQILRVNLTAGSVKKEPLDPKLAESYIGARGLGVRFMFDEVDPKVDSMGPDNKLIFAPGPFSGTFAPSAGRYEVITKGPLTGAIAASNSGGVFGPILKYAGYDALIVEGKAEAPVYLWIDDDRAEIRDASGLWGKNVPDTTDFIRTETDQDASVACIGPAGENQVLYACVMNEMSRAAGRSGVGAVMGSKKLKAVAAIGSGAVTVADRIAFRKAALQARAKIQAHPVGGSALKNYGTDVFVNILNKSGALPTRNFRDAYFPAAENISGESLTAKLLVRPKGCYSCIIACGRVSRVDGPGPEVFGEGPEYGTAWALGADCGVDDLGAIVRANQICNEQGLDTLSMGSTIACAMDLFENGIITPEDTVDVTLRFGNAEAMVEMVKKTAAMEGFGEKLAQGSYRLAESYGHPEYSMSTKKQEMPAFDPRAIQGIGLNYATSNRGGGHALGYITAGDLMDNPAKAAPHTPVGKAQWVVTFQNLNAALDSSGACLFCTFGIGPEELTEMLTALTGVQYTPEKFLEAGERIWNLERLWNLRGGFDGRDDTLPERLLKDPIKTGPSRGEVSHLKEMLAEYYALRGWDADGVPTDAKLKALSLV
jgi:aldehyde:ferredoxin oxidoreductase